MRGTVPYIWYHTHGWEYYLIDKGKSITIHLYDYIVKFKYKFEQYNFYSFRYYGYQ